MARYLIDVNLSYYFSIWHSDQYLHQIDINDSWCDKKIYKYAREHDLVIITKDTDFYYQIIISEPPPKVIHIRVGNMRLKQFNNFN